MRLAAILLDVVRRPTRSLAVLVLATISLPAAANLNVLVFGYDVINKRLVRFFSNTPGTVVSDIAVVGLAAGENLVKMDFRPATGELYGIAVGTGVGRLLKIDTASGALTQIGTAFFTDVGASIGMAFNPESDQIRLVSTADSNRRINPNNGAGIMTDGNLVWEAGDVNAGQLRSIAILAYSNHYFAAGSTTVYGIDGGLDVLAKFSFPNSGILATIGPLGVDVTNTGAMTIQPGTNTAYAALQPGLLATSNLYRINLGTGEATLIGGIGPIGNRLTIGGLAISPASPCLDIDGNGLVDPLTDGLLLLRTFFGLTGTAATSGAVLGTSPRNNWASLRQHLNANCGMHLPP